MLPCCCYAKPLRGFHSRGASALPGLVLSHGVIPTAWPCVFQGNCSTPDGTGLSTAQPTFLVQGKPAAAVHYTKNMPDIEALMQQWPAEAEELLHEMQLPDETLVSQHCRLLAIPSVAECCSRLSKCVSCLC